VDHPTQRAGRARLDIVAVAVLYAGALVVNLRSAAAMTTGQVLMGEEMSVSIRDVLFTVEQHAEASIWSTNVGAPLYYWVAAHLDPHYSLFSARDWKAGAMALLAPLLYLVLRRRSGCTRGAAALGGVTVVLLPGVAAFGWLATENGLEAVLGVAGLYLATTGRRGWWRLAPVLGALAISTHTAGIAWAAVIVGLCLWRAVRSTGRFEVRLLGAVGVLVVPAAIVLAPLLWWTAGPDRIVAGGGAVDGGLLANLLNLGHELGVDGASYYYFDSAPALGSMALAVAAAVAAVVAARRRAVWPWLAVALITVLMWLPAGNLPGVRRAIAIPVVAALVLAVAVDAGWRAAPRAVTAGALVAAAVAIVAPLAATTVSWQHSYATGEQQLTPDFPMLPGPMPATFARWDQQLRSGQLTVDDMVAHHDGLRTLAVVWMLADRSGRGTAGLPDPRLIVADTVPPRAPAPPPPLPPGPASPLESARQRS
jgi:hypothetical protein